MSGTFDIDDTLLRAWLLHRPVDERIAATLEERVLEDDAFGARLRAIETDLIDDHARGLLDDDDRRAVRRWLLATPADRTRLRAAVALAAAVRAAAPHSHGVRARRALVAFASAATVVIAVLAFRHAGTGRPASDAPAADLPTITLLASRQRGMPAGTDATATLSRNASGMRLQVEVTEGDANTRYAVSIADGARTVFVARDLEAKTAGAYRFVETAVKRGVLREGDFTVRVDVEAPPRVLQEWTVRAHLD